MVKGQGLKDPDFGESNREHNITSVIWAYSALLVSLSLVVGLVRIQLPKCSEIIRKKKTIQSIENTRRFADLKFPISNQTVRPRRQEQIAFSILPAHLPYTTTQRRIV